MNVIYSIAQSRAWLALGFLLASGWLFPGAALADNAKPDAAAEAAAPQLSPEQQRARQLYQSIHWTEGPCKFDVGANAEINVPAGYQITGRDGCVAWTN